MRMPLGSRVLFLLSALGLGLGAHMADYFSTTHIVKFDFHMAPFNPDPFDVDFTRRDECVFRLAKDVR